MKRLLYWVTGFLPCRLIREKNQPYLERYFVCQLASKKKKDAWGKPKPYFTAYIHRFLNSDPGKMFHNHPFYWSFSIVLHGSYIEFYIGKYNNVKRRRIAWFNWVSRKKFHRVELEPRMAQKEIWTLFIHGYRHRKTWEFINPTTGKIISKESPIHWVQNSPKGKYSQRQPL